MAGKRATDGERDGITGGGAKGISGGSGSEGAGRAGGSVPWAPRRNSGIIAFRAAIA